MDGAFQTMALVCISFGLRISECLALKWFDVDWLNAKLSVERGIVRQIVGDVKTEYSGRAMSIDPQCSRSSKSGDRRLNSPATAIGVLPVPSSWAACLGPILGCGRSSPERQRTRASGV